MTDSGLDFGEYKADAFWDYGVLYGRALRFPHGLVALSTGVAIMDGRRDRGSAPGSDPLAARLALPLQMRLDWDATPVVGLGLCGFADVNSEKTFAGFLVALTVGRLR